MDLAHWGFDRWPFSHPRATGFRTVGVAHEEALARLLFLVDERRRCGWLVGSAGTGKSCLFRQVKSYAERHGRCCLSIDTTAIGDADIATQLECQLLADRGDINSPSQSWSHVQQCFLNLALVGQPIVVLLDQFDLAINDAPLAACRLMSLADSTGAELTLLLSTRGPLTSRELLDRVDLTVELNAWSSDETNRFVKDAMRTAGATQEIFLPSAIATLQEVTHGIPRNVVQMCDLSLLAAMNDNRQQIDADLVEAIASELPRHVV